MENHTLYLETNTPQLNLFFERQGDPSFTGASGRDRLGVTGYVLPDGSTLQSVALSFAGPSAQEIQGGDHLEFWFANPFIRPVFLQPSMSGFGVDVARYVYTPDESTGFEPFDMAVAYYEMVYQSVVPAIAEIPVVYPRNGQVDAPGVYLHLSENDGLEFGKTYGYPITFTVGTNETGFVVDQAIMSGPEGTVSFQTIYGDAASGGFDVYNSVILVPDAPLAAGSTYKARVQITTDQGTRVAKTEFTVGTNTRPVPASFSARGATEELPVLTYELGTSD